jgi:hypothetical protein
MPTIRSEFNFEQFETVLQKIAHDIAIKAVTNPKGRIRITTYSNGKLGIVETDDFIIHFYASHISYSEGSWSKGIAWGFDVEEKLYSTSNHCTKISFYAPEGKEKEVAEKITEFIDKIMAASSIKPVPRFSLSQLKGKH